MSRSSAWLVSVVIALCVVMRSGGWLATRQGALNLGLSAPPAVAIGGDPAAVLTTAGWLVFTTLAAAAVYGLFRLAEGLLRADGARAPVRRLLLLAGLLLLSNLLVLAGLVGAITNQ